jgi:carbonic anhydrase/acetyltransferase-like protein (isoleucine patch superfamily)
VDDEQGLARSLSRARDALARSAGPPTHPALSGRSHGPVSSAFGVLALVLLVTAFMTGHHWMLVLALAAAAAGGILFVSSQARGLLGFDAQGPKEQTHVGMGATVASDAVLEAGARVEMGATVGARAVVRSGAVVKMGATVAADSLLEKGAVVSWGAMVDAGAVIQEGAIVGAGSHVQKGARVPPGMWLRPGATYGASAGLLPALGSRAKAAESDPRQARAAAVCDRLDAELRASPERVRAFLGGSAETLGSLRRTCEDLARREREIRVEADAAALGRLSEERAALEKRTAAEKDPLIGQSLRGALAAIDEQRRQREMLKLAADRLEAEHTRLLYTLEGLASQFVRLRTAGAQMEIEPAERERAVGQLRAELDAIADALEEVARTAPEAMSGAIAEGPATGGADVAAHDSVRARER